MTFIRHLKEVLTYLFNPWIDIFDQRSILSYWGAILFSFCFIILLRLARRRKMLHPRALVRFIFQKSIWLHRSSLLDYKLYFINMVLMAFVLGFFIAGLQFWANAAECLLSSLFSDAAETSITDSGVIIAITVALLVATDFGYWICHFTMHKSECLWELHKVHHSAVVMTPATEFRQHPIELIIFPNVIGFTTGITYALATHWWGTGTTTLAVSGYGTIICAHMFTFHHLRHSHINMPFTGLIGKLLHSPAHHLIHHSDNREHFNRNMGYMLSIWDWMAGTLHSPKPGERVTLGIGHEGADYDTVAKVFWLPLRNIWALLTRPAAVRTVAAKTTAQ